MAAKTRYSATDIGIEPLSPEENLDDFSCGNDKLDDFFHKEVVLCCKYKYLSAYTVKYRKTKEVVALFTLSNDSLVLEKDDVEELMGDIDEEYKFIFEMQSSFPSVNIGHLAVRKDLQSRGIGELVILYVCGFLTSYNLTGVQFITVDSLNNSRTNKFYNKTGFLYQSMEDINHDTRRMYLPLIDLIS